LSRRAQLTASFDVAAAGLPAQFRQVWWCHVVQTFVDHERDTLGDVEPMKVVTTNVCQPTVELVSVAPPHSLRTVTCPSMPLLPRRADSCNSQPYW